MRGQLLKRRDPIFVQRGKVKEPPSRIGDADGRAQALEWTLSAEDTEVHLQSHQYIVNAWIPYSYASASLIAPVAMWIMIETASIRDGARRYGWQRCAKQRIIMKSVLLENRL